MTGQRQEAVVDRAALAKHFYARPYTGPDAARVWLEGEGHELLPCARKGCGKRADDPIHLKPRDPAP